MRLRREGQPRPRARTTRDLTAAASSHVRFDNRWFIREPHGRETCCCDNARIQRSTRHRPRTTADLRGDTFDKLCIHQRESRTREGNGAWWMHTGADESPKEGYFYFGDRPMAVCLPRPRVLILLNPAQMYPPPWFILRRDYFTRCCVRQFGIAR